MTAVIPPLFGQWTGTIASTGLIRPLQITFGYQPGIGLTAAQQNLAIRTALTAAGRPFHASNLIAGFQFVNSKVLFRTGGGVLISDDITTAIVGIRSATPGPVNTSVILRKNTGFAGKKYRGRCLLPPTYAAESLIDQNGLIDSGTVTNIQGQWEDSRTAMSAAAITMVLLHADATAPTAITSLTVNNKIGTIGKRLRP